MKWRRRARARGGPGAVGRRAPAVRRDMGEHLGVEIVECVPGWRGPARGCVVGGGLAVVGVEVPLAARRLVAVHEVAEAGALPAVEVLHLGRLAPRGPRRVVVGVAEELVGAHRLDAEAGHEAPGVEGVRLGGDHARGRVRGPVVGESRTHRRCDAVVHLESVGAQLGDEAPHRGDDEVRALHVPAGGRELAERLHHEHAVRVGCRRREGADAAMQLVAEDPDGVAGGHRGRAWGERGDLNPRPPGPQPGALTS